MKLLAGLIIIGAIIVHLTGAVTFYYVKQRRYILTPQFVIMAEIITIIPMAINLRYWPY